MGHAPALQDVFFVAVQPLKDVKPSWRAIRPVDLTNAIAYLRAMTGPEFVSHKHAALR
jgi:hypothetical protein